LDTWKVWASFWVVLCVPWQLCHERHLCRGALSV
jgi:hypothetical protein